MMAQIPIDRAMQSEVKYERYSLVKTGSEVRYLKKYLSREIRSPQSFLLSLSYMYYHLLRFSTIHLRCCTISVRSRMLSIWGGLVQVIVEILLFYFDTVLLATNKLLVI